MRALLANGAYARYVHSLVGIIKLESSRLGLAPSGAFVLVEWSSILLQHAADDSDAWAQWGLDVIISDAQLLELCLASKASPNLKHSALVVTRRALRRVFGENSNAGEDILDKVISRLTEKSQLLGLRGAVFLGVIAGVCARLPWRRSELESCKGHYYSFYVREIVGSRHATPQHIGTALADFFSNFTTSEDLNTVLSPAFEKALLRAPEVVLDLLSLLVISLPPEIDLAQSLAESLLKPLLSNIKSQTLAIRNGAVSVFSVLLSRSRDDSFIDMVMSDILTPLSTHKLPAAEQRALHARMLSQVPFLPSRSRSACEKITQIIIKEPNEMALGAEASALTHHFSPFILSDVELTPVKKIDSILDTYLKGLSDKKPGIRKAWALRIGDILWSTIGQSANPIKTQFVETIAPKLIEIFHELVLNPQGAGQSGSIVIGYVVTALSDVILQVVQSEKLRSSILKAKIHERALSSAQKASFLLNHRFYTKLFDKDEYIWLVRALEACSEKLTENEDALPTSDAWVQAFLFLMTAADIPFGVRTQATSTMTDIYLRQPALIGDIVIHGLWTWYHSIEAGENDTAAAAAKTGTAKLHLALRSICPLHTDPRQRTFRLGVDVLQAQLINMLVLCRPEVLPNTSWIDSCLRVGQDPGALAQSKSVQCLERVERCRGFTSPDAPAPAIELAANNATADLAFVAPNPIIQLVLEKIECDLLAESVRKYGATEAAIARTPEGIVFVDVLGKEKRNLTVNKKARDYDTLKWEEEIRSQLAQKKGQERKLTPDEKAKVNAQLEKELAMRQEVRKLESQLKRGIGLIKALATGPPIEAAMWLGRSLKALLGVISAGASHIVGDTADEAYLACAGVVSSRLGSLRNFIGVATLRALDCSALPSRLEQEPLAGDIALFLPNQKRLTKL